MAVVTHPKAEGYGARIGDKWVRLAANPERPLRYFTKDSLADRLDQRGNTSQNVLDIGYAFARTELDGGEGLDWSPRELPVDQTVAANDVRRFWDSKNLDVSSPPAGKPYTLSLSTQFEVFDAGVLTAVNDIGASAVHVFVTNGNDIIWYDAWQTASQVGSFAIGSTAKMLAVSQGDEAMALSINGNVWYREPGTLIFTRVYELGDMDAIWFVKGRFVGFRQDIAGDNGELGELAPDGTFTVFDTTGVYDVVSVVSSGPAVVAAVTDGTLRSYVPEQSNQLDPSSVTLVIRGRTDLPKGEVASVLGGSTGILAVLTIADDPDEVGTTTRFYRAEVLDERSDYIVGQLQLQREWFGTTQVVDVLSNMSSSRDALFFSIIEADGTNYVWRFDLVTLGLSRHSETFDGRGNATTLFAGRGAVVDVANSVVYLESDNFHNEGYLITPNVTFGVNTDIAWLATVVEAFNLSDLGAQVELWRSVDPEAIQDPNHPSWIQVQRITQHGQSNVEIPLVGVTSRTLTLQLKLFSTGTEGADSPFVTRTAVRGIPVHRDWVVHLPVNVSDMVEVPGRMPVKVPGLGNTLQTDILSLIGEHIELEVIDPPLLFRGIVDNVEEPVTYISERGSVSVYAMMEFRGLRAEGDTFSFGTSGIGLGWLGVATIGIEESL